MNRTVVKKYSIGSARDERFCGSCQNQWVGETRAECDIFYQALKYAPDSKGRPRRLRCRACLMAEVKNG
jgi:hypothetical protein